MEMWVYLSGEIHSDWRGEVEDGARAAALSVHFDAPVTEHARSINSRPHPKTSSSTKPLP